MGFKCRECKEHLPVEYKIKQKGNICRKCFFNKYIKKELKPLILLDGETYKDVYFNSNFIVTNYGRIFSKPIEGVRSNNWVQKRGYLELKQSINTNGYLTVRINKTPKTVHRIVLMSFLPCNLSKQVNHINGIKTDNKLSNLEWMSCGENIRHAVRLGLISVSKVDCFSLDGVFIKTYNSVKDVCESLGIKNTNVYNMLNGKRYPKQIKGYIFKRSIDINKI